MLMGSASRLTRDIEDDTGAEDIDDELDGEDPEDGDEDEDLDPDVNDELDGEEGAPEPEPRRQPTRGENRVAAATRAAAEANRRVEAMERELATERANRGQQSDTERQRQRNEHLATLTGDQRTEFLLREQHQSTERQLQQIRFESYDASDRAAFESLAAQKPAIRAIATKVEEELGRIRAGGGNVSREVVAKYVLGDMAMAKATRANNAGAKRAQAGRERQAVRPSNGRGDVAADRSRKGSKLEDRLRDVKL